jgi:hypothetical protein
MLPNLIRPKGISHNSIPDDDVTAYAALYFLISELLLGSDTTLAT